MSSFFYICIRILTESILQGANFNRSGAFPICTMCRNKCTHPCIINRADLDVCSVRVERNDTLVMHMFIYNTAFSLDGQIKKNLPSRLYTPSLCTYNTGFSWFHTLPLWLSTAFFFSWYWQQLLQMFVKSSVPSPLLCIDLMSSQPLSTSFSD